MKNKRKTYDQYIRRNKIYRHRFLLIGLGVLVLAGLICAGVFLAKHIQRSNEDQTVYVDMTGPTFPLISMVYEDTQVNCLRGYTEEMETGYMRESLYLLENAYDIPVRINTYGTSVTRISYRLVNPADDNLIQEAEVTDTELSDQIILADIKIDNIIEENTEYLLDIELELDGEKNIHYYSRVKKDGSTTLSGQMDLVKRFHESVYNSSDEAALAFVTSHMATDYTKDDNRSFSSVSLYSSIRTMTWGQMKLTVEGDVDTHIIEVDGDYGYFRLNYIATRQEGDITEYYNVSEYFRVYVANGYEYVIDHERTADQLFEANTETIGTSSAKIGIVGEDSVDIRCNAEGTISVFSTDGTLWAMNTDTKSIRKVFSFSSGPEDVRGNYARHGVKILNVSDEGDIKFIVYGYMNAGLHEGAVGLGMYNYIYEDDVVTEQAFIPTTLPYDILRNAVGELFYLNSNNKLYMIADEYLYRLDVEAGTTEVVQEGLAEGMYMIHSSRKYIAWENGSDENRADSISILNMETDEIRNINADPGRSIKMLGFLNENPVYGLGKSGDIYTNADGDEYLLMSDMIVIGTDGAIQAEYDAGEGQYYYDSSSDYNRVIINRVKERGDSYAETEAFTIFANELEDRPEMELYSVYEDVKKTVYYVIFADRTTSAGELGIDNDYSIRFTNEKTVSIGNLFAPAGKYYVYAKGGIYSITEEPASAVVTAYDVAGIVVDEYGNVFYRRSRIPATTYLTSTGFDDAMEKARSGDMLELTGIALTQAVYYIGARIGFVWEYDGELCLITGYDISDNYTLVNIESGEETVLTSNYLESIFETSGRCYIVN